MKRGVPAVHPVLNRKHRARRAVSDLRAMVMPALMGVAVVLNVPVGCKRDEEGTPRAAASRQGAWFNEVSADVGLRFRHTSGEQGHFLFPETVTSGACAFDYDDDGWVDLYVVQGARLEGDPDPDAHNALFRNRGDGTFEDVTEHSGTGHAGYGMGCTYGDYDNDGDPDLYVTNLGANVLYRNERNGRFRDVTAEAHVSDTKWGASAAFADYDGDGFLDLFVVNYISWTIDQEIDCRSSSNQRSHCAPNNYNAPTTDTLYHNNGDGTFSNVTGAVGLDGTRGNGLGIACGDFDRNGRLDFYVTNDANPNRLWLNKGDHFEDEALLAGCALNMNGVAEAGMGVFAFDAEPDGDLDLFMVHLREETNTFYLNHGEWFEDATGGTGLGKPSVEFTSFGASYADFDGDGAADVYVANGALAMGGRVYRADDPYAEPNQLFRCTADGTFAEVMPRGGTAKPLIETSRGTAVADFDNDGDLDIVVVNKDGPLHYLRNEVGSMKQWIMFRVINKHGSDAVGAELMISSQGKKQHRMLFPSYGYCSANDARIHFGLGEEEIVESVTVRWPDGKEQTLGPFAAGQVYVIKQ